MARKKALHVVIVVPCQVADGEIVAENVAPWKGIPLLSPNSALTVASFALAAKDREVRVRIIDEFVSGLVTPKDFVGVDLCMISWISPSRFGAFRVAKAARKAGALVIGGGIDVTCMNEAGKIDEISAEIDSLGVGRMTSPMMAKILDDCETGQLDSIYMAQASDPWEFHPIPYWLINLKNYLFVAVESSRGCDKCCTFCAVWTVTGVCKVHHKPVAMLRQDLTYLASQGLRLVVDVADAFGIDYGRTLGEYLPLYWEFHKRYGMQYFTEMHVPAIIGKRKGRCKLRSNEEVGVSWDLLRLRVAKVHWQERPRRRGGSPAAA